MTFNFGQGLRHQTVMDVKEADNLGMAQALVSVIGVVESAVFCIPITFNDTPAKICHKCFHRVEFLIRLCGVGVILPIAARRIT